MKFKMYAIDMMTREIAAAAGDKEFIKPDVRLLRSLQAVKNLERPDLESLYLALLNAKFDN